MHPKQLDGAKNVSGGIKMVPKGYPKGAKQSRATTARREARKKAVERRRHDQVKELRLSARISTNDLRTKADQANRFLEQGHKVTARIEFKSNDGVKANMRPDAGAILYEEFCAMLNPHKVEVEGKMVGPSHMILTVAQEREKKGQAKKQKPKEKQVDAETQEVS